MKQDVVFNESSIRLAKLPIPQDSLNKRIYAELPFLTLSLPDILWLDKTKTIEYTQDTKTSQPISSQPNIENANTVSNLLNIPNESNKNIASAASLFINNITIAQTQQKFDCLKTQSTLDYQKINQS